MPKIPMTGFSTTAEFVSAWRNALKDTESTIRETEMVVPTIPFADAPPRTQRQPATATRTVSTLRKPATGLVIGCIAIVCLAASAAGVFVFASRFLNQPSPTQPSQPRLWNCRQPPPSLSLPGMSSCRMIFPSLPRSGGRVPLPKVPSNTMPNHCG
ncbi:MAG: hypothetical protein MZV64_19180 [Ignavibacteriales bacterium]|nr:hypothetical protein [Ignavibacteriales bacterium]